MNPAPLTVAEYQVRAREFAVYPKQFDVVYPLLGLCGEVAEVLDKFVDSFDRLYPENLPSELLTSLIRAKIECERAGRLAKRLRDGEGFSTPEENAEVARVLDLIKPELKLYVFVSEVADCGWNMADLLSGLGVSLEDALNGNLNKLTDRKNRNVLRGSGDFR